MREVELKSVVDDVAMRRSIVEEAGGRLEFEGKLIDARYGDTEDWLMIADHVLRLKRTRAERDISTGKDPHNS